MINRFVLLCLATVLFFMSKADAHICDNVWRQSDKLIVKPEITGLVVKDKASFKVYMQSNMDRGIKDNVRLVGRSEAFDVKVSPSAGHRIKPGKKFEYDVSLALKPGVRSGEYSLRFDAVVGDRTMRSYTMDSPKGKKWAVNEATKVPIISKGVPSIDGSSKDQCWKTASMMPPKSNVEGKVPKSKFIALLTSDQKNMYACINARGKTGQKDSIQLLIAPPGSKDIYKVVITADGNLSAFLAQDQLDARKLGITSSVKASDKSWSGELKIPVSAFGSDAKLEGERWKMNVIRKNIQGSGETSFWTGTTQNYSKLEGLGEIIFSR
ncbi:hypothetical protein ACFLS1_10180 [Verrucomicrobiota bacterium]